MESFGAAGLGQRFPQSRIRTPRQRRRNRRGAASLLNRDETSQLEDICKASERGNRMSMTVNTATLGGNHARHVMPMGLLVRQDVRRAEVSVSCDANNQRFLNARWLPMTASSSWQAHVHAG